MNNNNTVMILFLVIISVLAIYTVTSGEGFCNCAGLGWKTSKPTYHVYRPTKTYGQGQPVTLQSVNLGWRTGMPYDHFEATMKKSNNWAAGAGPSKNGGYMQNYGSPCGASAINMVAAPGSTKACPCSPSTAYANDLGVGVL